MIVDGPEQNRVKAILEETSYTIQNSIALSQQGTANVNLTLNGINSSTTFSGTKISISSLGDETLNSFTVSGTDLNDNVITERIVGPSAGNTSTGLKIFKTITSVQPTSSTNGNIEIGTSSAYQLTVIAEGTLEGDQF